MSGNSKPPVHYDPIRNIWIYRASAIGSCPKALYGYRLNIEPSSFPEVIERGMEEGALHEPAVAKKVKVTGVQKAVRMRVPGTKALIRGQVDGFLNESVAEIKSVSESFFADLARSLDRETFAADHPTYAWQFSFYMAATKRPGVYIIKNRNTGLIREWEVPTPWVDIETIFDRVQQIEAWAEKEEGLDQVACWPKQQTWGCPMSHLHDMDPQPEVATVDDGELAEWVAEWARLRVEGWAIDAAISELKEKVEKRLVEIGAGDKVQVGEMIVQTVRQHRTKFDHQLLKKEVKDWEKFYSPYETSFVRLVDREKDRESG